MRRTTVFAAALCALAASGPGHASESEQGFFRVVEGGATLIRVEDGQAEDARDNTPALAGDRVVLSSGARVEVILPDGHRLRLAQSADLELIALARSLDQEEPATALRLLDGALAIDVPGDGADRTQVDTDTARVLLDLGGLYLVEIDPRGATRVVVRNGRAELITEDEVTAVVAGEEAVVDPDPSARVALYEAPALTDVERWAQQLEAEAARAELEPLEPELRYAAAPLDRYGSWVDTGGRHAWRPRVEAEWRPYWNGHWTYSRAGLVWSSYEPWGWVPYHYGQWDLHASHGWLWYPGAVYAPAHVVWYSGPSYTAWIPTGYYRNFYARRFGFHVSFGSGFYGVSHADWRAYRDWTFCPTRSIGFRNQHRFHRDHRVLQHEGHGGHRRGFITADTRGLEPGRWRDSAALETAVLRRAHRRTGAERDLPDVSSVIARSPEVSSTLLRDLDRSDEGRRVANHRAAGPRADAAGGRGGDRSSETPRDATVAGDGDGRISAVGSAPRDRATDLPRADAAGEQPTTVRAHRSRGVESGPPVAGDRERVDRARGALDAVDRERAVSRRPELRGPEVDGNRERPATVDPGRSAASPRLTARRDFPADAPARGDASAARPAAPDRGARAPIERSAPAARPYQPGAGIERTAPVARDRGARAPIERSAPAARAYEPRARIEQTAPVARDHGARAPIERTAPAARAYEPPARIERTAPVVRDRGARAPIERAAPAARAYQPGAPIERSAPAPRDHGARGSFERAAPAARVERPRAAVEAAAPAVRDRGARAPVERSPALAPRALPQASRPAVQAPRGQGRVEAPRPAPAARSESATVSSPRGGSPGGGARARDGGARGGAGGGGGGRGQAARRH